ncbi:hypothetical protein ACIRP2_38170 [Streptomyces sp. NPDC101194]|uniref:hypothetical protein n=1 Tax=Streptomyces sp. NPDC101194 TaxID=3366127 RepID=UPI00382B1A83
MSLPPTLELLRCPTRRTHRLHPDRGARRLRLRIAATWPWHHELAAAFSRLIALPRPAT